VTEEGKVSGMKEEKKRKKKRKKKRRKKRKKDVHTSRVIGSDGWYQTHPSRPANLVLGSISNLSVFC